MGVCDECGQGQQEIQNLFGRPQHGRHHDRRCGAVNRCLGYRRVLRWGFPLGCGVRAVRGSAVRWSHAKVGFVCADVRTRF